MKPKSKKAVTTADLSVALAQLRKRAESGDTQAFADLVEIGSEIAGYIEELRRAFPGSAQKIATDRASWPVRYYSSAAADGKILQWAKKHLCREMKPGRKSRDFNSPSTFWAFTLHAWIERIRTGDLQFLGWKDEQRVVAGVRIRRIGYRAPMSENEFIEGIRRNLPPLTKRSFEKWFDVAWYLLVRWSHDGITRTSELLERRVDKRDEEIRKQIMRAWTSYETAVAKRKNQSKAKEMANGMCVEFPEDVTLRDSISTIVDRAETSRRAFLRNKFREHCKKVWFPK